MDCCSSCCCHISLWSIVLWSCHRLWYSLDLSLRLFTSFIGLHSTSSLTFCNSFRFSAQRWCAIIRWVRLFRLSTLLSRTSYSIKTCSLFHLGNHTRQIGRCSTSSIIKFDSHRLNPSISWVSILIRVPWLILLKNCQHLIDLIIASLFDIYFFFILPHFFKFVPTGLL